VAAAFHRGTMPLTNSSALGKLGAPLAAAAFDLGTVPQTNSSLSGVVGAPLVATSIFHEKIGLLQRKACYGSSIKRRLMCALPLSSVLIILFVSLLPRQARKKTGTENPASVKCQVTLSYVGTMR